MRDILEILIAIGNARRVVAPGMRRAFFIALFFLAPAFVWADLIPTYSATLDLIMVPQYPKPGDTVTLTVGGYGGSADAATYIWSVGSDVVLQGVGAKTFTLTAGALGDTQIVTVLATDNGIPKAAAQATIRPADIDIVWEGKTAAPPLYMGRPLPNGGSTITLLAVPHIVSGGKEIAPDSLIYNWQEGGAPLGNVSGYGKSSVKVTPPRFGDSFIVSVRAQTKDGTLAAEGSAIIQPQNPSVVVYENAPLLGVRFEKSASGAFVFTEEEVSFRAFPLFVESPAALLYQWALDGEAFDVDPGNPRDVTFRKVGSGSGAHSVTFSFSSPTSFLEHAESSFTLTF